MSANLSRSSSPAGAYRDRFTATMMKTLPAPLAVLARGEGARVWDTDGTQYLDFLAGIAVNSLGHARPVFVEAVSTQAATLAHISNYFASEPEIELAERLLRLTGGQRIFFGNSGAEAIEAAIKLARRTGRPRILALQGAFHGRTTGAAALTGKASMREPFLPLLPGVEHIEPTVEALGSALGDDVAALFVEPIQGEAGVLDLPAGYLAAARELTQRHGALLILDEIQTGAGRTGDWFAFQHDLPDGTFPDAVTLAKGIGGGFPIGALVAFGPAAELLQPGQHGSTFGGNPLATATSNAVLGEIERAGLVENARVRGEQLRAAILGIGSPLITDIQGRGLLLGIGLERPVAGAIAARALSLGLIVNAASDNRIRIAPPLIIGDAEIAEFVTLFTNALSSFADPNDGATR